MGFLATVKHVLIHISAAALLPRVRVNHHLIDAMPTEWKLFQNIPTDLEIIIMILEPFSNKYTNANRNAKLRHVMYN